MDVTKYLPDRGVDAARNLFEVVRRRSWSKPGRIHVELPALDDEEYGEYTATLRRELERIDGVHWAEANGATGRMVVAWDDGLTDREAILEVVDELETRYNFQSGDYDNSRPDHPADDEPLVRGVAQMATSAAGIGAGVVMKLLGREPSRRRFDLAAIMSLVGNVPHLREAIADRFGEPKTDTWLGLTNPIAQGIGSGPLGPTLHLMYDICRFFEAKARKQSWIEREAELCSHPRRVAAPRPPNRSRPVELPEGQIEKYAREAWNISLGGFIVGLADTQELERAVTPLLDALPKPAHYGRESFCVQLTRELAERNMVVMDPAALRRLDRIDCVVVDGTLLSADRYAIGLIACDSETDRAEAFRIAEDLLDPYVPEATRNRGEWTLAPAADHDLDEDWITKLRDRGATGDLLVLLRGTKPHAALSLRAVTNRTCRAFVDAVRDQGFDFIVAGEGPGIDQFQPDEIVAPDVVVSAIRRRQRDGRAVAYFGTDSPEACDAADFSLGLTIDDKTVLWGADVIAENRFSDATYLVEAIAEADRVARRCALLAGTGAGLGALSAIRGLEETRPGRVMLAVNAASLIALFYGHYRAGRIDRHLHLPPEPSTPWHRMRPGEVLDELATSLKGLDDEAVKARTEPAEKPPSTPQRILESIGRELANPLTPVLAGGAAVSAVAGTVADAGIVGAVIALNGLVGGMERYKAEQVIDEMADQNGFDVTTRRNGSWGDIDSKALVEGDIVRFGAGDVVPVDCRILDATRLEVDQSAITGESLPVPKSAEPDFAAQATDRSSMLYQGTAIVAGDVDAVVATGDGGAVNGFANISQPAPPKGGVEERLSEFSEVTLPFVSAAGGVLMSLGVLRRRKLKELVGPAVNLAVGAVPEGLPLLATMAELAAARRLSERGVVVRNPGAMEALGRTDYLCIDKTGTLTEGALQLYGVCDGEEIRGVDKTGPHRQVLETALRATPVRPANGEFPHATDRAIVEGTDSLDVDTGDWEFLDAIPFHTELAFHAVVGTLDGRRRIAVKGSPEAILERCSGHRSDGRWANLTNSRRKALLERAEELASRGLRILAVAERHFRDRDLDELSPGDIGGLTFRGFVLLSDPVRPQAKEALEVLQKAGVTPVMLTGDHPETARRIAREVGLELGEVLTGAAIAEMSDEELAEALERTTVIARMTPAQKVRIVEAARTADRAVAMTGDGGNDAAAIRLSDAGIALGADCATAARNAADLVVSDGRVDSIVEAVVEGRGMWRSVRDAISVLIGGNLGEILFMLGSGLVQTIPAMNARQLLLVNLFTDVAPALAIALRPPPNTSPEQLLHEGPEESLGQSLEMDIAWRAAVTGTAGLGSWLVARHTFQKKRASTIGLCTVVFTQLGQTLTTARPSVPVLVASLGSAAGLLAIVETPGVSHLLGCRPLGPVGLATAFGTSAAATGVAATVPRIGRWLDSIEQKLSERDEPTPADFYAEFCEHARR